ncbi:MAG TPA: glycosyltransferase family 1 protein [Candidatus Dormibacteraeota bacterium]
MSLTSCLIRTAEHESFAVFVSPSTRALFGSIEGPVEWVECPVSNEHVFRRIAFQQLRLPRLIRRSGIDVMCCLADVAPLATTRPVVLKVNSLHHYVTPSALGRARSAYRRLMIGASARRAALVIANSTATAGEIRRFLKVPAERLRLVYEAVDDTFEPLDDLAAVRSRLRQRYGIEGPYLLFVSVLYPYKNLDVAIRALSMVVQSGDFDGCLVIAGADPYRTIPASQALATALAIGDRLRFVGDVSQADLRDLYSGAEAFIYPSASETFGKPVLEAMRCRTPVVASTAGSIPEIAGGAALLFDPSDADALAARLRQLFNDPGLAHSLKEAGSARAASFSWRSVANGFRAALHEAHSKR